MNKIKKYSEEDKKRYREALKLGIHNLESKSYQDVFWSEKDSTNAIGKFQYVPSHWLDKMREFASKDGANYVDIDKIPTAQQYSKDRKKFQSKNDVREYFSWFLNNELFQNKFFEYEFEDKLQNAQKLFDQYGQKYNISLEGMISLVHHLGYGGIKKKLIQAEKNPSVLDIPVDKNNHKSVRQYVGEFEKNLMDNNYVLNTNVSELSKTQKKDLDSFKKRYNAIYNDKNLNEEERNRNIDLLENEIFDEGYKDQWSSYIQKENENKLKYYKEYEDPQSKEAMASFLLRNQDILIKNTENGDEVVLTDPTIINKLKGLTKEQLKEIGVESFVRVVPDKSTGKFLWENLSVLNPFSNPAKKIAEIGKKTGEFLNESENTTHYLRLGKNGLATMALQADNFHYKTTGKPYYHENYLNTESGFENGTLPLDFRNKKINYKEDVYAHREPNWDSRIEEKKKKQEEKKKKSEETTEKKTSTNVADENNANEKEKLLDSEFSKFKESYLLPEEIDIKDTFHYDEKNYKKELPITAIANGIIAAAATKEADKELPDFEDPASQALLEYGKEQKRISELGLKPEEELALKQQVSDVYQSHLTNITRASNGNRAIVLGAMDDISLMRNKGLIDIELADIERKEKAFQNYGSVLEYLDQKKSNVRKVNYEKDYQESLDKKTGAAELAKSAWANMLSEFDYQKQNGPGSFNHRYKENLLFNINGYSDAIKTGPGSYEHFLQSKQKLEEKNAKAVETQSAFETYVNDVEGGSTFFKKKVSDYGYSKYFKDFYLDKKTLPVQTENYQDYQDQ